MGIMETIFQALTKLVLRAAGDQAKAACANLQLCIDLEAHIEGVTHAMGQKLMERVRVEEEEEWSGVVMAGVVAREEAYHWEIGSGADEGDGSGVDKTTADEGGISGNMR